MHVLDGERRQRDRAMPVAVIQVPSKRKMRLEGGAVRWQAAMSRWRRRREVRFQKVTTMPSQHVPVPIRRMPARIRVLQRDHLVPRWKRRAAASLRLRDPDHQLLPKTLELRDGARQPLLSIKMRQRAVQELSNRLFRSRWVWRWKRRVSLFCVP